MSLRETELSRSQRARRSPSKRTETKQQREERLATGRAERRQLRQRLAEDDDAVLTFKEWCALNSVSERQGRRILASGSGPTVTKLTDKRVGNQPSREPRMAANAGAGVNAAPKAAGSKRDRSARGARREDQLGGQVGAEAKPDKAGAIALAEAMIRDGRMPSPEDARKRAKRAPVTTGNNVPERAADPAKQSSRHLRPRTAEEIANEQTAEQLALRIWAAMVAQKVLSGMSALMDELIQSHLLDDDDEEADEGWLDDHHKREKKILDEAIADGLDKYPDFDSDQQSAAQLRSRHCPRRRAAEGRPDEVRDRRDQVQGKGFRARNSSGWSSAISRRASRRTRDTASTCARDVPGSDVKEYGSRGRTSSKGTFCQSSRLREWRRVGRAVHRRMDARRQGSHRARGLVAPVRLPAEN